jgi:hypothetical protein
MAKKKVKLVDPKTTVPAPIYRAALKKVNELRKKAKLPALKELPRGEQGKACNCPVARALKECGVTTVDGSLIEYEIHHAFGVASDSIDAGDSIGNFVEEFDLSPKQRAEKRKREAEDKRREREQKKHDAARAKNPTSYWPTYRYPNSGYGFF